MKRLLSLLPLLVVWQIASLSIASPLFPPVTKVLSALWALIVSGEIVPHVAESMKNITGGFLLASAVGFGLALAMFQWKPAQSLLTPIVDAVRPIAALTLFPLIILVLGIGAAGKIFIIFWTAWPAVLLNTFDGLRRCDESILGAARVDGAGSFALLFRIAIPIASPAIMTGLRIGLSGGWISLVSSEMLGSSAGLGYSILAFSQTFRFPQMYAIVITIALLGLTMNVFLAWIQGVVEVTIGSKEKEQFISFNDRASAWSLQNLTIRRNKS